MKLKVYLGKFKKNIYFVLLLVLVMTFIHFSLILVRHEQNKINDFGDKYFTLYLIYIGIIIISLIITPGIYYKYYKKIFNPHINISLIKSIKKYIGDFFSAGIFMGIFYYVLQIPYIIIFNRDINLYFSRFIYETGYIFFLYLVSFVLPVIIVKEINGYDAIWFSVEYVLKNIKSTVLIFLFIIVERLITILLEFSIIYISSNILIWHKLVIEVFILWLFQFFIFGYAVFLLRQKTIENK